MLFRSNGWRYPLVGGTRERHFAGTNFKPRKVPENAQIPTSRVLACKCVKIGEECPEIIGLRCPLFRAIRVQWDLLSFL